MSGSVWMSFVGAKAVISVTPGPAVMLVLAQALLPGGRSFWAASGILLVNGLFFILAALGFGAVLAASTGAFVSVKWLSCAYLVYAGVRAFSGKSSVVSPGVATSRSGGQTCWSGAVLQLANPNAFLFFGAVLPQFVDPHQDYVPQIVTLGATGLVLDFLVLVSYGVLACRIGSLASIGRFRTLTNRAAGSLLVATGVFTAILR